MIGILLGAWLFFMVTFCAVGVGCRIACRCRRSRGLACVCGRHVESLKRVGAARVRAAGGPVANGSSRFRLAEARVRSLQKRYVEGRLSMEQYEVELDRVVGLT